MRSRKLYYAFSEHLTSDLITVAKSVVAEDGYRGLWRGIGPSMARVFFGVGLYFTTLESFLNILSRDDRSHGDRSLRGAGSSKQAFMAAAAARSIAATALCPITVVKTR